MSQSNPQASDTKEENMQATPTSPPVPTLETRLTDLEAQLKEKDQKYAYLYAEFENYKKRTLKEREDTLKYGWEPLARELLQVIDNLERAIQHTTKDSDTKLIEGLKMVQSHFLSLLEKQGVKIVQTQDAFDPHFHDAVAEEPSDLDAGKITQVHTKGYTLHGRLLRPARVVLSSGKNST